MVEIQDLVRRYGTFEAVRGLSLTIQGGEIFGLLGPNGAGKSTTLKILATLLKPTSGSVRLLNLDVLSQANEVRRVIGYVPEGAELYEALSGAEFLNLVADLHRLAPEQVASRRDPLVEAFALTADLDRPIGGYSKGMKQKVLLIAALQHDPEILLLDEPLDGLDVAAALRPRRHHSSGKAGRPRSAGAADRAERGRILLRAISRADRLDDPMSALGDRLVRLLGADPAVYTPVARAHAIIINRRARLARQRAGWIARHVPPFYFLCFMALVSGVAVSSVALLVAPLLLGAAAVLTFGAVFLTLVIIMDDFDVLVNASEYLVLAAHPHDGWSVLLAKIVVVGRSIAVLGACYFIPASIIVAVRSSFAPAAAISFLFGATCLTAAVASGGMLFAAALLSLWGRKALDRFLPMAQAIYMVTILFSTMGRQAMRHVTLPALSQTGIVQWIVPTTWFVWPLELAVGTYSGATWIRAALATGSLVAITAAGASWIGGRFGERLLDPPARATARKARAHRGARARSGLGPVRLVAGNPETRAVLKLTAAHLRSDFVFRSNLVATAVTPLILLSSIYLSRSAKGIGGRPEFTLGVLAFGLAVMLGSVVRILTMSTRPEGLWCVLTSPTQRTRFSLAAVTMIRAFVVLPYIGLVTIVAVVTKAGPPWSIVLAIAGLGVLAEAVLQFWRGFYRDMPFSRTMRSAGKMGGSQLSTMFGGMIVSAGAVGALASAMHFGFWPQIAVIVIFSFALAFAWSWARWRVSRAAEALEISTMRSA